MKPAVSDGCCWREDVKKTPYMSHCSVNIFRERLLRVTTVETSRGLLVELNVAMFRNVKRGAAARPSISQPTPEPGRGLKVSYPIRTG